MCSDSQGGKMVVDACNFSGVTRAVVIKVGAGHLRASIYIVPWCPARLPPSQLPSSPVKSDESTGKMSGRLGKAAGTEGTLLLPCETCYFFLLDLKCRAEFIILHCVDIVGSFWGYWCHGCHLPSSLLLFRSPIPVHFSSDAFHIYPWICLYPCMTFFVNLS